MNIYKTLLTKQLIEYISDRKTIEFKEMSLICDELQMRDDRDVVLYSHLGLDLYLNEIINASSVFKSLLSKDFATQMYGIVIDEIQSSNDVMYQQTEHVALETSFGGEIVDDSTSINITGSTISFVGKSQIDSLENSFNINSKYSLSCLANIVSKGIEIFDALLEPLNERSPQLPKIPRDDWKSGIFYRTDLRAIHDGVNESMRKLDARSQCDMIDSVLEFLCPILDAKNASVVLAKLGGIKSDSVKINHFIEQKKASILQSISLSPA